MIDLAHYRMRQHTGEPEFSGAEGATAPETLRRQDLVLELNSGEIPAERDAEGITISGQRTEGASPVAPLRAITVPDGVKYPCLPGQRKGLLTAMPHPMFCAVPAGRESGHLLSDGATVLDHNIHSPRFIRTRQDLIAAIQGLTRGEEPR